MCVLLNLFIYFVSNPNTIIHRTLHKNKSVTDRCLDGGWYLTLNSGKGKVMFVNRVAM